VFSGAIGVAAVRGRIVMDTTSIGILFSRSSSACFLCSFNARPKMAVVAEVTLVYGILAMRS